MVTNIDPTPPSLIPGSRERAFFEQLKNRITGAAEFVPAQIGFTTDGVLLGRATPGAGGGEEIEIGASLILVGSTLERSALEGEVEAAVGSNTLTIVDGAVINARLADMEQSTIKGRAAGEGTGPPSDLSAAEATQIINIFGPDTGTGGTKGLVPPPEAGDGVDKFLKADGVWEVPVSATLADGDKGDITVASSGTVWTIDDAAVSYDKIQNVSQQALLGAFAAGDVEEITIGNGLEMSAGALALADGVSLLLLADGSSALLLGSAGLQVDDTVIQTGDTPTFGELSADPSDPAEGQWVLWMSDGTGTGDDGDIMVKITAGAVTKTATLVDFSAV